MPAYNTEKYIEEAILSIIKQDIGLNNIQLIIVNDGSPDNLLKIANKYSSIYTGNIKVINKKNGGPGSAINLGINYIKGKYVNFMDSDDILKKDALKKVFKFFENNYEKTDVVSIPVVFFEAREGGHHLNYKYKKGSRVINLKTEWDAPQLQACSAFVKKEVLDLGYKFDERVNYADDAKFLQQILSEKQTLGVVSNTAYYYRIRRGANKSMIQSSAKEKNWYIPCIKYSYLDLINFYIRKNGYVPKSVQNTICTDLQWKIKNKRIPNELLNNEEKSEYISLIKKVLIEIDNEIIDYQKYINKDIKKAMYELKGDEIKYKLLNGSPSLSINTKIIYSEEKDAVLFLDFINIKEKKCRIEGRYSSVFNNKPEIIVIENNKKYFAKVEVPVKDGCVIKEVTTYIYYFSIEFIIQNESEYQFVIQYDNCSFLPQNIIYGQYFPLSLKLKKMYCHINDFIMLRKYEKLYFIKYNKSKHIKKECCFIFELIKYNENDELFKAIKKAIFVRILVDIYKIFQNKKIWLFRDRTNVADDNGAVLYKFIKQKNNNIKPIFALSHLSKEYDVIKKEGNIVDALSWKYKIIYLLSDYVFSSSADYDAIKPFGDHNEPYKDLEHGVKRVFLQHGITKDDLSDWLNKIEMNFTGFVCSAKQERDSILNGKYRYSIDDLWLTGLPRYDNLYDNREKIIVIAPTWRAYLIGDKEKDDSREISSDYLKSKYYITYNALLNNKKLGKEIKEKEYQLVFYSHPTFKDYANLFKNNNNFLIEPDIKYLDIFSKASLLITDYSSVAFDFAYLKKPVLYFQFDEEEFFKNHGIYSRGYFSYTKNGFGEIEDNVDCLVDRIIEYINRDCIMKEKYINRVNDFFEYSDKNNCERVLEKVYRIERQKNID